MIRDTPQQNGMAERLNRTINEGVTSMLSQAALPRFLWADAARAFIYVHNHSPSNTRGFKTPCELWTGKTPSVSHLRTWGCLAYVHVQKDERPALSPHAKPMIFIRYAAEQKGYMFYNTKSSRVIVSDSAAFMEDSFPGTIRGEISQKSPFPPLEPPTTPDVPISHPDPLMDHPPAPLLDRSSSPSQLHDIPPSESHNSSTPPVSDSGERLVI